jgi:hypothetical protein
MKPERRAVQIALSNYDQAFTPTSALVLAVLGSVAQMVAVDTGRSISFVVDGYAINRGERPAPLSRA